MQELTYRDIQDNLVIIKINKLYSPDLSELELYEVTRGCWARKIESVQDAEYCLAVCNGEVVEVYKIDYWDKAGTSEYLTRSIEPENGRIEFTGAVASETIRKKYIGKSVKGLFKPGEADPVKVFLVNKDFGVGINTPLAPQRINTNGTVICGRCAYGFHRSERCPECGQLIDYNDDTAIGVDSSSFREKYREEFEIYVEERTTRERAEKGKGPLKSLSTIISDTFAMEDIVTTKPFSYWLESDAKMEEARGILVEEFTKRKRNNPETDAAQYIRDMKMFRDFYRTINDKS